jgi:hypothetical protein
MIRFLFALGATALFAFNPAMAEEKPPVFFEGKVVKDSKAVKLDPSKAYVLVRTPNAMALHFTKLPSAEDQIAYEKLKVAAFAEAREDYAKALKKYERDLQLSKKSSSVKKPKKPAEPTESNFQFTPFGQLANFTVGAFNRFTSEKGESSYLHQVTPGTYRVYGQVDPLLGLGVCYCMGSVTFEALAGKIVDLGTLGPDPANSAEPEKGDSSSPRFAAYTMAWTPATQSTAVDPRIASFPRTPATFRAAGKTPNYMGIEISRIPEIPGVIAYDRDRIIDLRGASN